MTITPYKLNRFTPLICQHYTQAICSSLMADPRHCLTDNNHSMIPVASVLSHNNASSLPNKQSKLPSIVRGTKPKNYTG